MTGVTAGAGSAGSAGARAAARLHVGSRAHPTQPGSLRRRHLRTKSFSPRSVTTSSSSDLLLVTV